MCVDAVQDEMAAFLEGIEQVEEAHRVDQTLFLLRPSGTRREAAIVASGHVFCFDVTSLGFGAFCMIQSLPLGVDLKDVFNHRM